MSDDLDELELLEIEEPPGATEPEAAPLPWGADPEAGASERPGGSAIERRLRIERVERGGES